MKITDEICKAFLEAQNSALNEGHGGGAYAHGLQAVLDLIEKEQDGIGVQADRGGELEIQCLRGDGNCEWGLEAHGSGDYGWVTVSDLVRLDAQHATEVHR